MKNAGESPEQIAEYRSLILKRLEEIAREDNLEHLVSYADVAKAFPNGPHEHSFDIKAIDTRELEVWAIEHGFEVSFAKDATSEEDLKFKMPLVLFRKRKKP